jgi:hydrogenase maturation factor HypE
LPTPDDVAAKIVDLCLPDFTDTAKLYDFRAGKLLDFVPPA